IDIQKSLILIVQLFMFADEWIFPDKENSQLESSSPLPIAYETSHDVSGSAPSDDQTYESKESAEVPEDVFTYSSKPRSAPHGKPLSLSSEDCTFSLDLKEEISKDWRGAQMEDDFYGNESNGEEYNWKDYQPSNMTMSEMQMLASMKRQQNEELEYNGPSHGLSASQINNCNISISTSSDDTNTWNSCLPAPVNQGSHYQKEMNPLSQSNPRDWLQVFSPPIIPPSQQVAEYTKASANISAQGENEEEDEVLTLLYDPCLNCYFDPETGKYYELA
uniref:Uncharacterized protein n=1 Tax=Naja naja TaxID=35670 RepID=A0A8C6X2K3_NAJNA